MTNETLKNKVREAIKGASQGFSSANKHAVSLEINAGTYSRIMAGETDRVLSPAEWIRLARMLQVNLRDTPQWQTAETPTFRYITTQLTKCQTDAISCIICDAADIGKTYTAKHYAKNNSNAVYIDCSQVKSKQKLVRKIAQEFGVEYKGKYADVYEDLVYYINSIAAPMIILDEAGDLDYAAFLELKALWNATERSCGWCMMGADGLKEKMRRAITNKKVGYTELYSRFGTRYQRATPEGSEALEEFTILQAALIIKANAPTANIDEMVRKTDKSLRRIHNEISKLKVA